MDKYLDEQQIQQAKACLLNLATTTGEKLAVLAELVTQPYRSQAISLLCEVVVNVSEALIRSTALQILHSLEFNQEIVNVVSEVWEITRDPDLTDLLIKQRWVASQPLKLRVLTALQTCNLEIFNSYGPEILEPLLIAISDSSPVIVERVGVVVSSYTTRSEVLDQIWQNERYARLAAAIIRRRWQYTNSIGEWVLHNLSLGEIQTLVTAEKPELVRPIMHACAYKNSTLAYRAEQVLVQFKLSTTHAEMCRTSMEFDDERLHRIALATGYKFPEPFEQALFYFLTRQWSYYEAIDFDQRLLVLAYEVATEKLRKRVTEVVREAGRIEFIELIVGKRAGQKSSDLTELNETDWAFALELLNNGKNWLKIWELALTVPPKRSLSLMQLFRDIEWKPVEPAAQIIFKRLHHLAQICDQTDIELARLVQFQERLERYSAANINLAIVLLEETQINDTSISFQAVSVASRMVAIAKRPVAQNNVDDFVLLQKAREDKTLTENERRWLQFMETLLGWRWRHEIEIEEASFRQNTPESQFDVIIDEAV